MKRKFLPMMMLLCITGVAFAQTHTIKVTVPDTLQKVYIAGTFNGWNPSADTMTLKSVSPKIYEFTFESADTLGGIKYKFLSGPDWSYQQVQSADFVFKTDSIVTVNEFQHIYHKDQAKTVTIDVLVPTTVYELNLTGSFNGWNPTSHPMVKVDSTIDGKEYTLDIAVLDTTTLEFKFVAGPGWSYEQTNSANYKYMDPAGGVVICMDFKAIFNPNAVGDITLNITVPEGTAEVWVIGDFGEWKLENAIQATKNQDNTYTAIIPNVGNISYKVYNHPDWTYEEAADAAGTSVTDRTASFNDGPVFNITVAFWKALYVPTAVNNQNDVKNRIYTTRYQTVIVEEVDQEVTIFDIQGRIVQDVRTKGTFTSQRLRTGVYMIRVDGQTRKVLVQ